MSTALDRLQEHSPPSAEKRLIFWAEAVTREPSQQETAGFFRLYLATVSVLPTRLE
jgi:hypothetical protein